MASITEFLEARIAEDEAEAREAITERVKATPNEGSDTGLQCWPDSPVPAVLVGPERVIAECAAKRAILENAMSIGDDGHYAAEYMPSREHEKHPDEVGGRRIYPGHPSYTQTVIFSGVLRALAAVYADHPDYQQEWA